MNGIIKNGLILVGLVLVVGLGYYLYTQNISFVTGEDSSALANKAKLQSDQSLRRLKELQNITLDEQIFSDARFTSLEDFSSNPPLLPTGKSNPFQADN